MMTIKTEQDAFDGRDSFKVRGEIEFGGCDEKASATIYAAGSRKSEAVERAIKQIDELVEFLNGSKEKLGSI